VTVEIELRGLARARGYFRAAPQVAAQAASLALNDAGRRAATQGSRLIPKQVNLPTRYVRERLKLSKASNAGDLEAIVAGDDNPVSLARYAKQPLVRGRPPFVRVSQRGGGSELKRVFPINLANNNRGLAIRLKAGESAEGRLKPFGSARRSEGAKSSLFLLYGPSVGQVFRTVSNDISGKTADFLEGEFVRQFDRLSRGK